MKFLLVLSLQIITTVCIGQTSYFKENDSTLLELGKHFSNCKTLESSKAIDKKKIDIDHSVVRLRNDLYNSVFTKQQLLTLSKTYAKTIHDQTLNSKNIDSTEEIIFTPYFNGNLRVSYSATLKKDSIISFKIGIGTNTQLDCNTSGNTVQYFDFIYLKSYFSEQINFPLLLKPLTTDIVLSKKIK